jgi:C1A family cysteine protease
MSLLQPEVLAKSLDFKPDTEFVDNQGSLGSCVAHAGQTALEIMFHRAGTPQDLSRMYLYYYVQKMAGTLGTKGGGWIADLGPILESVGCCKETEWDYNIAKLGMEPDAKAVEAGKRLFPTGSTKLDNPEYDIINLKRTLNRGYPLITEMQVHPEFYTLKGPWRTHRWNVNTLPTGLHAVTMIGYDDNAERFLFENSWGPGWGDGGFFGIPYEHVYPQLVTNGHFYFKKMPAPAVVQPEYKTISPSYFNADTGILEIPQIKVSPEYGKPSYTAEYIKLKLINPGLLKIDDPQILGKGYPFFNILPLGAKPGEHKLHLPTVVVGADTYKNVSMQSFIAEIISVGQK